jgi:sulfite reductase (NADPH) hemoprotein beta-component
MAIIDELIEKWAKQRQPKEAFGDFVIRAGIVKPVIDSARDFYE